MPNTKKITHPWGETGLTLYCVIRREADGYLLNDDDGAFANAPADPYIAMTEDGTLKGLYEKSEARAAWDDGVYTVMVYSQAGASPAPASDTVIGSGEFYIDTDTEVNTSTIQTNIDTIDTAVDTIALAVTTIDTVVDTIALAVTTIDTVVDTIALAVTTIDTVVDTIALAVTTIDTVVDTIALAVTTIDTVVDTIALAVTTIDTVVDTISLAATTIDTVVDAIKLKTDTINSGGALTWTYTLTDSSTGAAIPDVHVRLTSDAAGQVTLRTATTDANGVATFYFDSSDSGTTVYVWSTKAGYNFALDTEVLS